jgi:hypothetical protein
MFTGKRPARAAGSEAKAVNTAEATWDWDWDNHQIDSSTPRAQVDPDAELRPVAVDESLTTLLFSTPAAPTPTPASNPTIEREPEPMWSDAQALLFEPA